MSSKQLSLGKYNTDKVDHGYLDIYDSFFSSLVDHEINLLEIGIYEGGSLLLWRDYFPNGKIVGIDINIPMDFESGERISTFQGSQSDVQFLSLVANNTAPDGFDVIIDDASHISYLTKISFWHLFDNHLKPGGFYLIEDWGTGYWDDWPDGCHYKRRISLKSKLLSYLFANYKIPSRIPIKACLYSHTYGMVGLIKQLVDEQGAHDLTRERYISKSKRSSKFEYMQIYPSIVVIKKAL